MKQVGFIIIVIALLVASYAAAAEVTVTKVGNLTHITIAGRFTQSVAPYLPVIRALNRAKRGDTIIFRITSPGGYDSSANKIIKALNKTRARTVGTVLGYAASNGAYLLCHMDKVNLAPDTAIMYHAGGMSFPGYTPYTDIIRFATLNLNASIAEQSICVDKGIITLKELELMREGQDVRLEGSVVMKRLKSRGKSSVK